ncbi:MAG: DUF2183 domain-containing protein [Deltaproteobacteria bacterium]|nr:DUF2183 domain-containing protein [Deltaproteobacteria bacterium]
MIARACFVCVLGFASRAFAVDLVVAPAVGTPRELVIEGRLFSHRPSSDDPLWNNLGTLAGWTRNGATITASFAGTSATAVTDDDGDFTVTLTPAQPFIGGRGTALVSARDVSARAPVQIVGGTPDFFIVSDFDDTVAISKIAEPGGILRTGLLVDGKTHPPVPMMATFYRCLLARPTRPPLVFVSGSPIQFAPRLVDFLATNGFPFGGLHLRRLSPSTMKDYKQPVIRRLLARFTSPVILIGDSGERDPEVYKEIRAEAGARVLRTYIRDAGHTDDASRFADALLFKDALDAIADAKARGFIVATCP